MRKKSIAILMAAMLSMTGCGVASNTESSVGGINVTTDVEATSKEEPANSPEATAEQVDEITYTYPKLNLTSINEVVRSEDGRKDFLYYDIEYATVDSEKYPELAQGLQIWMGKDQSMLEDLKKEYTNEVKEYNENNSEDTMGELTYSISQRIGQRRSDAKVLSLVTIYSDYRGGAHGSNGLTGVTFDVETGKELTLSHIMSDQEQFESIALDYILDSVEKSYRDGLFSEYKETIQNGISNLNWALTDYGIQVIYGEYEIAPYAAGIITVDIPYSSIKGCMKPEYVPAEDAPVILTINQYDSYKLHLAGKEQDVTFQNTINQEDYYLEKVTLVMDETEKNLFEANEPTGYYDASCFYLRNADGVSYFILELLGDNDQRTLTLFQEEDGELIETDTLESSIETATMHATEFDCAKTIDVFGTYSARKTYTIRADGKFTTSDTRYRYVNSLNTDSTRILTAKQDIPLVIDGQESTLAKGTEIYPTGADEEKLYFQTPSGEEGYLEYAGSMNGVQTIDGTEVTKLFDGIQYAG